MKVTSDKCVALLKTRKEKQKTIEREQKEIGVKRRRKLW